MVSKINDDIRKSLKVADIRCYELAEYMGVSKWAIYEWLSVPLSEDKRARIMQAIETYPGNENKRPQKENADIRRLMVLYEMNGFQVAISVGIAKSTLYRWLKNPLKQEQREKIINAIRQQA